MNYSKQFAMFLLFVGVFSIALNLYNPSEWNDRNPANTTEHSGNSNDHHVPWWMTY